MFRTKTSQMVARQHPSCKCQLSHTGSVAASQKLLYERRQVTPTCLGPIPAASTARTVRHILKHMLQGDLHDTMSVTVSVLI